MKKFKFVSGFICGALIFGSIGAIASNGIESITAKFNPNLPIYLNGEKLNLENGAINYKDTNYLSIRETAEALKLDVYWNPQTKNIELTSVVKQDDIETDIDGTSDTANETETESTNNEIVTNEKDDEKLSNDINTSDIVYLLLNDLIEIATKSNVTISFYEVIGTYHYLFNAAGYEVEPFIDFYDVNGAIYLSEEKFLEDLSSHQLERFRMDGFETITKYSINQGIVEKTN